MEKINTDYQQRNCNMQAKFFKPFNRDAAPLKKISVNFPGCPSRDVTPLTNGRISFGKPWFLC